MSDEIKTVFPNRLDLGDITYVPILDGANMCLVAMAACMSFHKTCEDLEVRLRVRAQAAVSSLRRSRGTALADDGGGSLFRSRQPRQCRGNAQQYKEHRGEVSHEQEPAGVGEDDAGEPADQG